MGKLIWVVQTIAGEELFFGFYPQPVFNYFKTEKCYERKIILVLLMVTINKN
ncbi:MAG: hypothetical protein WC895_04020 [Candidatus Shapirobacteria bacterium]|jgi:hypothetical protein